MKKIMSALLCAMMLFTCCAAVAEPVAEKYKLGVNNDFEFRCNIPEGYQVDVEWMDSTLMVGHLEHEDATKPTMYFYIAYSEVMSDVVKMNELPQETLTELEDTFREDGEVEISYMETAYGTKLMLVREVGEENDYFVIFTIYRGYEIEFMMMANDESATLGDEQIKMAVDFLSDLDFVDLAK